MMKRLFIFSLLLCASLRTFSQTQVQEFNCFSILAGRGTTADGSVMLAHNEDDYGEQIFNWLVVPATDYPAGETITAVNGAKISQAAHTNRYIWFDMPGMAFSDSYMNEYGVTIASNACPSREDAPALTDGGLTWELRQLMAQRGTSARHTVKVAAGLLDQYGYASSGRTYCIADPHEAWMLSVVRGKHYVALRVPDEAVAIIPNYYTITVVNLSDTLNCMASPDLLIYARQRGWYNPETDGPFNFRKVYGSPQSLNHPVNIQRMWSAVNSLSNRSFKLEDEFFWLVTPGRKVTVDKLAKILSSHYEGTALDATAGYRKGHPHGEHAHGICASHTQYGFVAQLRNWMPAEVGAMLWMMPRRPCVQALIPVYCGIETFPADFSLCSSQEAMANHFSKPADLHAAAPHHVYWQFSMVADSADSNYQASVRKIGPAAEKFNLAQFKKQHDFEKAVLADWKKDKRQARRRLDAITEEAVKRWLAVTGEIMNDRTDHR